MTNEELNSIGMNVNQINRGMDQLNCSDDAFAIARAIECNSMILFAVAKILLGKEVNDD